ncbi:response regulator [Azospirillum halopraeferens]|uniref:response regulator n=1 Tax=Azospirillum halopraeferens TaxID=34010 RepID=UPI000421AD1D|nr:response regulator transcription factor [Azospirillum halopraeferens]
MTRVLLIDDHPMVLQGCRRVLLDADVDDVLEASNAVAGYRLYRRHRPEMAIIDLALQGNGLAGLSLIHRIRLHDSRTPILVFSMHGDAVIVSRALEAGANGYLLKDTAPEDFLAAVHAVRRGRPYLSHQLAVQVAMLGSRSRESSLGTVTPRELQTLALIADGKSYGQIADELGVSYKTVANTCSQLKVKLGAHNLPELIRMSIEFLSSSPNRSRQPTFAARAV